MAIRLKWHHWEKASWIAGVLALVVALLAFIPHSTESATRPDIRGSWEQVAANRIALNKLNAHDWVGAQKKDEFPPGIINHSFLAQYTLEYRDHESYLVIFSTTTNENVCHVCEPYLSFFEFKKVDDGWKLVGQDIGSLHAGGFGEVSAKDIRAVVIGDNLYAIAINGGFLSYGNLMSWTELYSRIGDKFKLILTVRDSSESVGGEHGEVVKTRAGSFKLKEGPTGFYDVAVREEVQSPLGAKRHVLYKVNYKFDGIRYAISDPVYECRLNAHKVESACHEIPSEGWEQKESYFNHADDIYEATGVD